MARLDLDKDFLSLRVGKTSSSIGPGKVRRVPLPADVFAECRDDSVHSVIAPANY
jgi:hypothetical protein